MQSIPNQEAKLFEIFFSHTIRRQQKARIDKQRFVYYTSAETAMNIIKNKEVWMRNATCMNDFMEVQYGLNCLSEAYKSASGQAFTHVLNNMFPGISSEVETIFDSWSGYFKNDTYLACISEHIDAEDAFGRLSMWRAYGKDSGVALVLNNRSFLTPSVALTAYTHPVAYLNKEGVEVELRNITENIIREIDFLKMQEQEIIKHFVFNVFKLAALCIKHPGFKEEKEWRVVYSPTMVASRCFEKEIRAVNGIPQQIYKIPLQEISNEGFFGTNIPDLIDRVIIGPTEYPLAIYKAFVDLLSDAGVVEAEKKVIVSNVPLRR